MMRVEIDEYIAVGATVIGLASILTRRSREKDSSKIAEIDADVVHELKSIQDTCKKINLDISATIIEPRLKRPLESPAEVRVIMDAVFAELTNKVFLFVPPHRAEYYENEALLSEAARTAYPKANAELRKAGNAYAAGLSNATVYHCMAALEEGLRSLASDLQIRFDIQNWQNVIDEIESQIAVLRKTLARSQEKNDRLQFLSEAAK